MAANTPIATDPKIPEISTLNYDGNNVFATWSASQDAGVTGYQIQIVMETKTVFLSQTMVGRSTTSGIVAVGALSGNAQYYVQIQALWNTSPGELSDPTPLVTAIPQMQQAYFDGTEVVAKWKSSMAPALGFQLKLYSKDSGYTYPVATTLNPFATQLILNIPQGFDLTQQWVIVVLAQSSPNNFGTSLALPLPKPIPTLTLASVTYDISVGLRATWNALMGMGISYYILKVMSSQDDSHYQIRLPGEGTFSGTLPLPLLSPLKAYTFRLLALNQNGVGVATAAQSIITIIPKLLQTVYDGSKVTLIWSPTVSPMVQGYAMNVISLTSGDTQRGVQGNTTASQGSITIALITDQDYVANVGSYNSIGGIQGFGASIPILNQRPSIQSVCCQSDHITVQWQGVAIPSVAGYRIAITDGTTTLRGEVTNPYATQCILGYTAATFSTSTPVTATITAYTLQGASSISNSITVLTQLPILQSASLNGNDLELNWSTVTGATYTARILSKSTAQAYSVPVSTNTATIPIPGQLGSDADFQIQIMAQTAAGITSQSDAVTLPTASAVVERAVYNGTTLSMVWSIRREFNATRIGYTLVVQETGTQITYTKTLTTPNSLSGINDSLPIAGLDSTKQYLAYVETLYDNQISVVSPTVTLVPICPAQPTAIYTGGEVIVNWAAVADPNNIISGYEIRVVNAANDTVYRSFVQGNTSVMGIVRLLQPIDEVKTFYVLLEAVSNPGTSAIAPKLNLTGLRPVLQSVHYLGTGIDIHFQGILSPSCTGYTLSVAPSDASTIPITFAVSAMAVSGTIPLTNPLDPTKVWIAAVTANFTGLANSKSDGTSIPLAQPTNAQIFMDRNEARVAWDPIPTSLSPGKFSYFAELMQESNTLESQVTTGTLARFQLPFSPTNLSVQVSVVQGIARNFPSTVIPLLGTIPILISAKTDPVTNILTMVWNDCLADYYEVYVNDALPVKVSATTYPLANVLKANANTTVFIRPVKATGSSSVYGFPSACYTLPTQQPTITKTRFNGSAVLVAWERVSHVSGYGILILEQDNTTPVAQMTADASSTQTFISFTVDPTKIYSAVVQALSGESGNYSGLASLAVPIFTKAFIPSLQLAATYSPFVFPAMSLSMALSPNIGISGQDLVLYLPDIGTGTPLTSLPIKSNIDLPTTFILDRNTSGSETTYPYTLTLSGTGKAWTFGADPIRSGLQTHYLAFLTNCDSYHVSSWGIAYLQDLIARILPQTFQEILYYHFGLNLQGTGYVDLRPGMVLRVVNAEYQSVPTSGSTSQWVTGYVGSQSVDYDIGSLAGGTLWSVGLDAFLSQLVMNGVLTVDVPANNPAQNAQDAGAEAADLYFPGFNAPFHRLFIPNKLISASSIGTNDTTKNFTIASANTYKDLVNTKNTLTGNTVAYFRGRSVLKLCIRVSVNGNNFVVPIGTTVGNMLEKMGCLPPSTSCNLAGIRLMRAMAPVVFDPTLSLATNFHYEVLLDWEKMPLYALNKGGWNVLSLPLVTGDRLEF